MRANRGGHPSVEIAPILGAVVAATTAARRQRRLRVADVQEHLPGLWLREASDCLQHRRQLSRALELSLDQRGQSIGLLLGCVLKARLFLQELQVLH